MVVGELSCVNGRTFYCYGSFQFIDNVMLFPTFKLLLPPVDLPLYFSLSLASTGSTPPCLPDHVIQLDATCPSHSSPLPDPDYVPHSPYTSLKLLTDASFFIREPEI